MSNICINDLEGIKQAEMHFLSLREQEVCSDNNRILTKNLQTQSSQETKDRLLTRYIYDVCTQNFRGRSLKAEGRLLALERSSPLLRLLW